MAIKRQSNFSEKEKNSLGKDLFTPDKNWQTNNYLIDNEQIRKECNLNIDELKNKINQNLKAKQVKKIENKENNNTIFNKIFKGFKYKYHNIHIAKNEDFKKKGLLNKINFQIRTIYNPNYKYLYKNNNIGPKWSLLSSRGQHLFKEQNYKTSLSYNNNNDLLYYKNDIKGFVNMAKQARRKSLFGHKLKNDNEIYFNKDNYLLSTPKSENRNYRSTPDFNRYLSRGNINNLPKKGERIINGELYPNYNSIEAGIKTLVHYNRNRKNIRIFKDKRNFNSLNYNDINYDATKAFEKIYGNKIKSVPDFNKTTSRKKNELPFFFNDITNRTLFSVWTEKSLIMNNFFGSKLYNLCGNMKKDKNKYKNMKLSKIRKYFSFDNLSANNKNKALDELKDKVNKFNKLIIKPEIKNDESF